MNSICGKRADVAILGGGIVGCSIAYHLALAGCKDVVVIDRGNLARPPGSSGHAPGLMGQLSSSIALMAAARYSVQLYSQVPSDDPAFLNVGSLEIARDAARLAAYERKAILARTANLDAELVSVERMRELVPFLDTSELVGGLFVPSDGVVSAARAHSGLMNLAKVSGVRFMEEAAVHGIRIESGRVRAVETTRGRLDCSRLVIAAGVWGNEVLKTVNLRLPLFPVQHPYAKTAPLALLAEDSPEARYPIVRDIDNLVYYRQHGNRLGFGWYLHEPALFDVAQAASAEVPYAADLFGEPNLALFPFLRSSPRSERLNGLFSMTPDGLPLVGEFESVRDLWVAEAVWFTHAGGVGRLVADLMSDKPASFDWVDFNVRRFANADLQVCTSKALNLYRKIYG